MEINFFMKFIYIIMFASCVFVGCGVDTKEQSRQKISPEELQLPDQLATNIVVDFIDTSFLKARLWAKTGKVFYSRGETELVDSIRVEFYSKSTGRRASILTADSAKINDRTKDMYAFGRVIVVSDSPKTILRTSLLEWKNRAQKIYSNEYVEIIRPDEEIRGYGFESDVNLTNYRIYKVSGVKK
jgi:LPS export ABC transporter protein LptC